MSLLPSPPALSECQGKLQELHRLLQSLESLHRIPSAPVIPTHQVRVKGGGRDCSGPLIPIPSWGRPACLPPAASRLSLCSFYLGHCRHATPMCLGDLCSPPWLFPTWWVKLLFLNLPGLGDN